MAAKKAVAKKAVRKTAKVSGVVRTLKQPALRKVDKRAVRRLKKLRRNAEKLYAGIADTEGTATQKAQNERGALRLTQADELITIIDMMLTQEKAGWLQ